MASLTGVFREARAAEREGGEKWFGERARHAPGARFAVSITIPPRQRNPPSGYRHGPSARAGVSAAIVSPTAAAVKLGGCLDSAVRRSPTLATEGRSRGGRFEAGGNRAAVPRFFQALTEEEEVV